MLMIVLDVTIVNVALPSIQRDLGMTQSNLAWVVNAYLIAFGGLLLLAGRLGDLLGRKRILVCGLIVFTAASVLCGLSWTPELLMGARFLQGVGGAMTSSVILGVIVTLFPEPHDEAKAIGIYTFVAVGGGSIGLVAGGLLTQALNWHWIFFVNLPIGIVAVALTVRLIAADRGIGLGQGADMTGALLVTLALMLGVYTIVETSDYGWGSAHTAGFGTGAIVLLTLFAIRQRYAANPLLPPGIFRSRNMSGANLVAALTVAAILGMFFLVSLYLQRVLGFGPLAIGLAFLPNALVMGVLSLGISARLYTRYGARAVLIPSLALIAVGLGLLARVPTGGAYVANVLPSMVLIGLGSGVAFPALVTLAMSDATDSDSGLASGLVNATQQIGGALGLAVLATLATSRTHQLLAGGVGSAAALAGGYRLAFAIAAGLAIAAILVAVVVLRPVAAEEPSLAAGVEFEDDAPVTAYSIVRGAE
ncbi:MAG TPA: MFS transporter [Candidatus Angelobacter sp.]|nr:MFS transporter [Candidatus Angelobacter sp.]